MMKKVNFYSMVREDGEYIAKLHQGYTDGTYNYYKKESLWHAIHPVNGLSICSYHTRKAAAEHAHAPRIVERIAAALERRPEAAEQFETAVKKAKEAA
jgi:hypothetical protein